MGTAERLETDDETAPSQDDEDGPQGDAPPESVAGLVEQLGQDTSRLAFREAQLRAARHTSEIRQAALAVAVVLASAVALLAAFALANWAAVAALSSSLPGWQAPLVLAAAWMVVGLGLLIVLQARARKLGWDWHRMLRADQAEIVQGRELARDEAAEEARASLDRLGSTVASEAGALIAAAVMPVIGGAVSAGEAIIEEIDEITDTIEDVLPGGSMINRVADLALVPGRYCVRVVRMAVRVSG